MGIVEWWNNGMVELWNGGMDFFSHPFYLLVCLLIIILWLSFQFTCFYFQAILLCMCVFVANWNNQTANTVLCFIKNSFCVLAIAALK